MTPTVALVCCDTDARRELVRKAPLNGLDYVELGDDPRVLTVYFLGDAPKNLVRQNVRVRGGKRIRDIEVMDIEIHRSPDEDHDGWMVVTLDRAGDFSTYSLCIVGLDREGQPTDEPPPDFDRRYACVDFSFEAAGPAELDCSTPVACPPPTREQPDINYLAKDYASFRQLIFDRLALLMPEWKERHVPDVGVTLVELLAYAGDHLSYYQDAVATEAYLDTARRRISVRRHVRLVDYALHEGCNARTWMVLDVSADRMLLDSRDYYFVTHADPMDAAMLHEEDLPRLQPLPYAVFEPIVQGDTTTRTFHRQHNAIRFHTWQGTQCCLRKGATSATLVDPGAPGDSGDPGQSGPAGKSDDGRRHRRAEDGRHDAPPEPRHALDLQPCDVLIFEEVKGPKTGIDSDASPAHRHAVRLSRVTPGIDPIVDPKTNRPTLIVDVEWAPEDALPFPLCISSIGPDCELVEDVSVARGNVVLVDHGRSVCDPLDDRVPTVTVEPQCCDECSPREVQKVPGSYEPRLPRGDVTFAEPLPPCKLPSMGCGERRFTPASAMLRQDPRRALPSVALEGYPTAPNGEPAFAAADVDDPEPLARRLALAAGAGDESAPAAWLRSQLARTSRDELDHWAANEAGLPLPAPLRDEILQILRALRQTWGPRRDLLASGPDDRDFSVEIDDDRWVYVRFGEGKGGACPEAGMSFRACYRVGNGTVGNVAAESIRHIVFRRGYPSGEMIRARNPFPTTGGVAPELVQDAKLLAPYVFRHRLERAITADDYAEIVLRDFASEVQRAAAEVRWNGRGAEVLVAVDALASASADSGLLCRIERHLERYRRIGHDVHVVAAEPVPLTIEMSIRVRPGYLRGHVKAALLDTFSNRVLDDGRRGYFHPDNVTLGQSVDVSHLVATAQAVTGVESIRITVLERMFEGPNGELDSGVLPIGPLEVARVDNDPSLPENGKLTIVMEGGR
jgi:hypothetical protein